MIRKSFLTGEYIFYAKDRANRPYGIRKRNIENKPKELCPFCIENKAMTPLPIYEDKDDLIRIVPNKYPFISEDVNCYGVHDVVIDTNEHYEKLKDFSDEHIYRLLDVIRNRLKNLYNDSRIKYVQVFKNDGIDAGASQPHSHWQITAMTVVPHKLEVMLGRLKQYHKDNNACYFCDNINDDLIVDMNKDFICYLPRESKFPYGMNILSREHISSINAINSSQLMNLATMLRDSVKRLYKLIPDVDYNICLYTLANDNEHCDYFHMYFEIIPRIGYMAGFEFSTGCHINSVLPEDGAKELRNIKL